MQCLKHVERDGMRIYYDVPIPARDGARLMGDLYFPAKEGVYPVILTYGPYGKQQPFQVQTPVPWERLNRETDQVRHGTTCSHMTWETVDPEKWTPAEYVVARVDARGYGRTPGVIDPFARQEAEDFYDCIEWIGEQAWCSGKVGLLGVSYYAILQWSVAALRPKHLAAMCPWEGASDVYRDQFRKGGILSCNRGPDNNWWRSMILPGQYGTGVRSYLNPVSGLYAGGDETLPEHELAMNRRNSIEVARLHELEDDWYHQRSPVLEAIETPLLSCGNWGGHNLHLRGNIEGYLRAGSRHKWLDMHVGTHYTDFYSEEGYALQRSFFDHFLKDAENGWKSRPSIRLQTRRIDAPVAVRFEREWPLVRTSWTRLYLTPKTLSLDTDIAAETSSASFVAKRESVTFMTPAFARNMEITGPIAARLFISSTTEDADLVCVMRVIDPAGDEVTFQGASAPEVPLTMGWLRATHRKVDPAKSTPWRPWHTHDALQNLTPGDIYAVDVEILPTSVALSAGFRLALTIQAHDWEKSRNFQDDAWDKRAERYSGTTTLYGGGHHAGYLLLPVIAEEGEEREDG